MVPLVPLPTRATICVGEETRNEAAPRLPKLTDVAPFKFVPIIVTISPTLAWAGEKLVIVGSGARNTNPLRCAVPPGVVRLIAPVAPVCAGIAVMTLSETTVYEAARTPPKFTTLTADWLRKPLPTMRTVSPARAESGTKRVITGTGANTNPVREAEPPRVVTTTLPVAPVLKRAVMRLGELTT